MGIVCTGADRVVVVAVSGEVDHHSARDMMMALDRDIDRMLPRKLALDLGGVSFMDSSGIALVLRCQRRIQELEGEMVVTNAPDQVRKVLGTAGIDRLIPFE